MFLCSMSLATGCHRVRYLAVYFFGFADLSVLSSSCSSPFSSESSSSSAILGMKSFLTDSSSESVSSERQH